MEKLTSYVLGAVILLSSYPSAAQLPADERLCAPGSCHGNLDSSVPSSELEVTYAKGMLKITAARCRLGDVLEIVRARTGTELEIAPEAAREIVSVEIGPSTPLSALRQLLEGEKSNYIIISGPEPGQVERLVMTVRPLPLPTAGPGTLTALQARGAPAAAQVRSSEQPSTDISTTPVAVELPPNYTPGNVQDLASVSTPSAEYTNLSSEGSLPPASGSERPANTPAPGQWPWQVERSLNGVGYQSPAEYAKQFQTGERR